MGVARYKFNRDLFSSWSQDMAYILGYFIADGNVSKTAQSISMTLHDKDIEFLHYWQDVIGSTHTLKRYTKGKPQYVSLVLCGGKIIEDLAALGVLANKRATWHGFKKEPPKEFRHAIVRGFFDGDGWVCVRPGKYHKMLGAGFANKSHEWLKQIRNWANLSSVGCLQNRKTHWQLEFANRDSRLLREYMYDGNFSLKRKRLKYFSV